MIHPHLVPLRLFAIRTGLERVFPERECHPLTFVRNSHHEHILTSHLVLFHLWKMTFLEEGLILIPVLIECDPGSILGSRHHELASSAAAPVGREIDFLVELRSIRKIGGGVQVDIGLVPSQRFVPLLA